MQYIIFAAEFHNAMGPGKGTFCLMLEIESICRLLKIPQNVQVFMMIHHSLDVMYGSHVVQTILILSIHLL